MAKKTDERESVGITTTKITDDQGRLQHDVLFAAFEGDQLFNIMAAQDHQFKLKLIGQDIDWLQALVTANMAMMAAMARAHLRLDWVLNEGLAAQEEYERIFALKFPHAVEAAKAYLANPFEPILHENGKTFKVATLEGLAAEQGWDAKSGDTGPILSKPRRPSNHDHREGVRDLQYGLDYIVTRATVDGRFPIGTPICVDLRKDSDGDATFVLWGMTRVGNREYPPGRSNDVYHINSWEDLYDRLEGVEVVLDIARARKRVDVLQHEIRQLEITYGLASPKKKD